MADNDVFERAMVANGYTIKKHGGAFRWGVARPLEDKARGKGGGGVSSSEGSES